MLHLGGPLDSVCKAILVSNWVATAEASRRQGVLRCDLVIMNLEEPVPADALTAAHALQATECRSRAV
jgi:hypothetical protein